jgi:hypothetical protein
MTDETFEALLSTRVRAYADGGVRPVDRFAVADAMIASGTGLRRGRLLGWRRFRGAGAVGRRPMRVLAVAVLVALLAAAALFTLGPGRNSVVPPVPVTPTEAPATAQPTTTPSGSAQVGSLADESIFLREPSDDPGAMDVVAVNAGGQERVIRRLETSLLPAGATFRPSGAVGRDGWLSVDVSNGQAVGQGTWALLDLGDPKRPPTLVPYSAVLGGAWSSDGWFATVTPNTRVCCSVDVVDARAGVTQHLGDTDLPGGGPDLIWAADGSGLLVYVQHEVDPVLFGIRPRDGGPVRPYVPALEDRRGARWVTEGGRQLITCSKGPDCATDSVAVQDAEGKTVEWYAGTVPDAHLLDASFTADGRSIWLLFDRVEAGRHKALVTRMLDAPGKVGPGVEPGVDGIDLGPDVAYLWFAGLSRDGSQVAVGYWLGALGGATVDGPTAIVPRTPNSHTSLHSGNFVGFVPGSAADGWPGGGAFETVPDAVIPSVLPQPTPGVTPTPDPNATAPPVPSASQ